METARWPHQTRLRTPVWPTTRPGFEFVNIHTCTHGGTRQDHGDHGDHGGRSAHITWRIYYPKQAKAAQASPSKPRLTPSRRAGRTIETSCSAPMHVRTTSTPCAPVATASRRYLASCVPGRPGGSSKRSCVHDQLLWRARCFLLHPMLPMISRQTWRSGFSFVHSKKHCRP